MTDKILSLEDERQIIRLMNLYCHYINDGNAEEWAGLFSENGCFERLNPSPASVGGLETPAGATEGRDALHELMIGRRKIFRGLVRHQNSDIVLFKGDHDDHAVGRSTMLITDWRDGPGRVSVITDCRSEFVRKPDGWRIQSVRLKTLPMVAS